MVSRSNAIDRMDALLRRASRHMEKLREGPSPDRVALNELRRAATRLLDQCDQLLGVPEAQQPSPPDASSTGERMRQVFDGLHCAVAVFWPLDDGRDFIVSDLNPAACSMEQVSRDEVRDRRLIELFPSAGESGLLDVLRRVCRTGQPEYHSVSEHGRGRLTAWREYYVHRLARGEIAAVYFDRTGEKRTEEELRGSKLQLQLGMEIANQGLWEFPVDGEPGYCSARYYTMLGYRPDEFPPTHEEIFSRVHPDDLEVLNRETRAHLEQRKPAFECVFRMRAADGSWRWIISHGMVTERGPDGRAISMLGINTDITKQKETETRLRESQERLRLLFEGIDDVILVHDEAGRILDCNEAACRRLGYTREELLSMSTGDIDDPSFSARFESRLRRQFEAGRLACEGMHVAKDGRRIPVDINTSVITYNGRRAVLGVSRDITDRKRVEKELAKSRRRLLEAQRIGHIGSWEHDPDTGEIAWSEEMHRIFGTDPQTFQPTVEAIRQCVHPADVSGLDAAMANAWKTGDPYFLEFRVRHPNGQVCVVGSRAEPVRDASGRVVRIAGTDQDITERKKYEDFLLGVTKRVTVHTGQGFFRELVAELAEAFKADVALIGEIAADNPNMVRTLAVSMDNQPADNFDYALAGTPCEQVAAPQTCTYSSDVCALFPQDRMLADIGAQAYIGSPLLSTEGKPIGLIAIIFCRPIDKAPLLASMLDVFALRTAAEIQRIHAEQRRRQLEAQVQHSQKLESLGVLAGGIAHDFNNLLMGILGNADLALEEMPLTVHGRSHVEEIVVEAQRAADLCRQLLAYTGRAKLTVEPCTLNSLVRDMERMLRVSVSKKSVMDYSLADPLPAIEGDPVQMRQVIMNLVINASEALGDGGGIIRVGTGAGELTGEHARRHCVDRDAQAGQYVWLEVQDNGCGMDAKTVERIFEPFFTTKFTGRGLGLAAVLGIVRAHRGTLEVDSEPGRGTRIRVYFPETGAQAEARQEAVEQVARWRGQGTVLVVDDERSAREITRLYLERAGFEVLTAVDGFEAFEIFQERADDIVLVVLDLTMPRMSGQETYYRMQQLRPGLHVIMVSGYTESDISDTLPGEKGVVFIQKPFKAVDLLTRVRSLLGQ